MNCVIQNKIKTILCLSVFSLLLLVLQKPYLASASTSDFVINNFSADYILTREDKQGTLKIVENIDLTFNDINHGILRAIPDSYKGHSLQLEVDSIWSATGAATAYTTTHQNGNTVLKIGDKTSTVTGHQNYKISYKLNNVIGFYKDHDELYWDINGDQWQQPFTTVKVIVHLPAGLTNFTEPLCFAGSRGGTDKNCTVTYDDQSKQTVAQTTAALTAQQTLTIVQGFSKGYFTPSTSYENFRDMLPNILKFTLPTLLLGGYAFIRWRNKGRDARGKGTIVAQYEPPFNLRPAEVGTLMDFKVDPKDISATIIDLAVRKYLKIIEETIEHKLMSDTTKYSFMLTNSDVTGLNNFETSVLTGLFSSVAMEQDSIISLDQLKNKFYITVSLVKKAVIKNLVDGGYFISDPARSGGILWVVAIVLVAAGIFGISTLGLAFTAGAVLAAIIVAIFAGLMPARTARGSDAKEKALGLKLYLQTAEADRIKMMQSPNAPYAENAGSPIKSVDLFEKLLPYAVVFGVEREWAKEFADIYKSAPDWYSGNINSFSAIYLASSLGGSFQNNMTTSFAAPSNSGSSGFGGGGGFSGGGGGGGGGGGW